MIRFIHTSDWQLGMTRQFLGDEAQARYAEDRIEAIRSIGRLAGDQDAEFILACGDTFDSAFPDRRTVLRAFEALREVPVPVYLLPGNHDPLCPGGIYDSELFLTSQPPNVRVIRSSDPVPVGDGAEIVGVPWRSRRPGRDIMSEVCRALEQGPVRIIAGHGILDVLSPDRTDLSRIDSEVLRAVLDRGAAAYVALGDRHSMLRPISGVPIWYSGSPEVTAFRDVAAGQVLVVTLGDGEPRVDGYEVGRWAFHREQFTVMRSEDVQAVADWLDALPAKARAALRLTLDGSLSLRAYSELEATLDHAAEIFAAVERRTGDLVVMPEDEDFEDAGFSGFVQTSVKDLRGRLGGDDDDAVAARDALGLLLRLSGRET